MWFLLAGCNAVLALTQYLFWLDTGGVHHVAICTLMVVASVVTARGLTK